MSDKQRRWLAKLPALWLLAGLAIVALAFCLCAALALIPAVSQELAGGPLAAPQPAPIRDERLAQSDPGWRADYLGYSSPEQMPVADQGSAGAAQAGSMDLWPAQRGVFLYGRAQEYDCQGQVCTFRLDMAGNSYQVTLEQNYFVNDSVSLKQRQARVFGYLQQEAGAAGLVTAQLIDRGANWWAWWQPAWVTVYRNHDWGAPVWVYSVLDRNPYSPVTMDMYGTGPALAGAGAGQRTIRQGDRILLHGYWLEGKANDPMAFQTESIYQLVAGRYAPVSGQPNPAPQPTVTLRPGGGP